MKWTEAEGQKLIASAVHKVLEARAPGRANLTYLLTNAMKELPTDDGDFMDAYEATQKYITTHAGRGGPLSFKAGLMGGYALKPQRVNHNSHNSRGKKRAKNNKHKRTK